MEVAEGSQLMGSVAKEWKGTQGGEQGKLKGSNYEFVLCVGIVENKGR